MSTPEPEPRKTPAPPPASAKKPPVVVPSGLTKRDLLMVITIVVVLVGFIVLAVISSTKPPKNMLRGVIRGKNATGERETLLDVRRQGVSSKTVDTGYYLKVYVPEEDRVYEVIVEKELWDTKKEGDTLDFLRPPNEQKF